MSHDLLPFVAFWGVWLIIPIMVDGNVSFELIPAMVAAGASILVCGTSSVFHRDGDILSNIERTREAACRGLAMRAAAKEGRHVDAA